MKHYTSIIHSVLIVFLLFAVAYLYLSNQQLESQLNPRLICPMNPHQGVPEKFDSFSESDTSILLTFMGVGFGLFAFLTFQSVKDLFKSKISEIGDKQKQIEEDYINHVQELKDTKAIIVYNMADSVYDDLLSVLKNKNNIKNVDRQIIKLSISAIGGFSEYFSIVKSESTKNKLKETISKLIGYAYDALPKEGKVELNSIDYEGFVNSQRKVLHVGDLEDQQKLAFIFSKINFVNN